MTEATGPPGRRGQPGSAGPILRVLSWNVRGLRDDVDALVATVRAVEPDLFAVQEAPRGPRWRSRCARLAARCGLVVAAGGGGDARGNLLLARLAVRVRADEVRPYPPTPGQQRRGLALARCELGGAPFLAVGTHLSLDPAERVRQARVLRSVADEGASGTGVESAAPRMVLAADLNEAPDGPAWRAVAEWLVDAGADDPTPTFSCAAPRRRIDGILVGSAIGVQRYAVLDTPAIRRSSDHFPVYVELVLPGG